MTDLDGTAAPRSYRPGAWYGVLGARASLLLPPSERTRVAGLWEIVDAGAGFDVVLDALLAGGLSDLSGFVLWSATDGVTQAVARGPVKVVFTTAGGEEVLDGSEAATWAERRVAAVLSTRVEVEEVAGPDLGLVSGLVRVGRVDEPAYAAATEPAEPAEPAEPVDPVDPEDPEDPADPVATEDATGLEAEREPAPRSYPMADPLNDPLEDPLGDPLGDPLADAEVTEVLAPTWSRTPPPVAPVPPAAPVPPRLHCLPRLRRGPGTTAGPAAGTTPRGPATGPARDPGAAAGTRRDRATGRAAGHLQRRDDPGRPGRTGRSRARGAPIRRRPAAPAGQCRPGRRSPPRTWRCVRAREPTTAPPSSPTSGRPTGRCWSSRASPRRACSPASPSS